MTATTADVLDRAADVIAEHGLCQGAWWTGWVAWTPGTACCTGGAIAVATGCTTIRDAFAAWRAPHPAFVAFAEHLGYKHRQHRLIEWNDAPERTAALVVQELRACAANLRTREAA